MGRHVRVQRANVWWTITNGACYHISPKKPRRPIDGFILGAAYTGDVHSLLLMSAVDGYNTAVYELVLFTHDALNQVKEYMLGMHIERIQADWGSARAPYQVPLVEQLQEIIKRRDRCG